MQQRNLIIGLLVVLGLAAVGALAWNVLFGVPEPSGEVTAIPVSSQPEADAGSAADSTAAEDSESGSTDAVAGADAQTEPAASQRTFTISQEESEVRFQIGEILFGEPKTVIGVNDQVAAQVLIDFDSPQNSQVGIVQINARTFVTDNSNRNGAISNRILNSGDFEFITFTPTAYSGLPETVELGQTVAFQILGDLTIREITNQVTFDATVTLASEDRLEGSATSQIEREPFDLVIPSVPQVAGVDEVLILEIDFVALAD